MELTSTPPKGSENGLHRIAYYHFLFDFHYPIFTLAAPVRAGSFFLVVTAIVLQSSKMVLLPLY